MHRLEGVRERFDPSDVYLDTATMGLPPRSTVQALTEDLGRWQRGEVRAAEYDDVVDRARRSYATLARVDPSWVAVGSQVSPLVGVIAASVPTGGEVVVCDRDFTSVLFPFLAQADRGLTVTAVPLDRIEEAVTDRTDWVAVSAVQSSDGSVADVAALAAAARRHGARLLVDLTQACGWLPVDGSLADVTVCGAYKWLLSPRGTAFMSIRPDLWDHVIPASAGWYAGADIWESIYGPPLRLAGDARRFDVSPAWWNWVGTASSLDLLVEVGVERITTHNRALAARAAGALGEPDPGSSILSLDRDVDAEVLARRGVKAAVRAGSLRVSFHLYNDETDVDALVEALS